ncbi:MAG: flagellar biosynthesis anti-sigma factor FlgM [Candidatus Eremiobacteraeota bacterium]|nr:flagellar biosynthesis anti-sigma factor FlgM [Candidatus Eremiobacteraeota bacterium]
MKINGQQNQLSKIEKSRPKINDKSVKKSKNRSVSSGLLEISSLASELSDIHNDIKNIPDVRTEKVENLRQKIQHGDYEIDYDKLSDILSKYL